MNPYKAKKLFTLLYLCIYKLESITKPIQVKRKEKKNRSWKMGFKLNSLFLLLSLLILTILSGADQALAYVKKPHVSQRNKTALAAVAGRGGGKEMLKGRKQTSGCNLFQGRWVFDASYPFYDSSTCPFIDGEFDCLKFGRPDKQFLKYSWQPDSCTVPRYVTSTSISTYYT